MIEKNAPMQFDPNKHVVGVSESFKATVMQIEPGHSNGAEGMTMGVATMSENSPHGGEMHPDGDEVLYLISGQVNVVFEDEDFKDVLMNPGDGLVVPRGVWHRVDILEISQIFYATPGPGGEIRPL